MRKVPTWVWFGGFGGLWLLFSSRAQAAVAHVVQGRKRALLPAGKKVGKGQKYLRKRSATHLHRGIDISAPKGAKIYAPLGGTVAAFWPNGRVSGYGNALVVRHAGKDQTLYAHLNAFAPGIAKGSVVKQGDLLGFVGQTQLPRAEMRTAPHLHFEVHLEHTMKVNENNPPRMDPEVWLTRLGVPIADGL